MCIILDYQSYQGLSVIIHGYQWLAMVINGYHWLSMVIIVFPWLSRPLDYLDVKLLTKK